MKDWDTMTISKVGQSTLPKWWREVSGLSKGGVIEVRPAKDGRNSIILTPQKPKRLGAVGLAKQFGKSPHPFSVVERHTLPSK